MIKSKKEAGLNLDFKIIILFFYFLLWTIAFTTDPKLTIVFTLLHLIFN